MKVLFLNASDIAGGAALAAFRLHKGLQSIGVESRMLVQAKFSDDRTVIGPTTKMEKVLGKLRPHLDAFSLRFYPDRRPIFFSSSIVPDTLTSKVATLNPDGIHLQWIEGGFMRLETLRRFNKPLVWNLMDMWPFIGGVSL